jgi:hypothetical protein
MALGRADRPPPKVPRRARHPKAERFRQLYPVAVFESADQIADRPVLKARDGAGTLIDRRMGDRLRRLQVDDAEVIGKRRAEPLAIRLLDEPDPAPAGRAERAMRRDGLAAGETGRREDDVERSSGKGASPAEAFGPSIGPNRFRSRKRGLIADHGASIDQVRFGPAREILPGCARRDALKRRPWPQTIS